jgi:RNA polymerase sigma factor (sigma-70 family)
VASTSVVPAETAIAASILVYEHSEQKLLALAKLGQSDAFDKLCQLHSRRILNQVIRITRNREDAEDAVQDSLLRAFMHIQTFDERSSFATWLTRIAINSALMILRRKRTRGEVSLVGSAEHGETERVWEIADRAPDPEASYGRREREILLHRALRGLRPGIRKAIELRQLQEHSLKQAAAAMGISVAAAKGRLFHARAALRKSPVLRPFSRRRQRGGIRALAA